MLTLPTAFNEHRFREGELVNWLVKCDTGAAVRYFATTEFHLATEAAFVEGRLSASVRISQAIDPFTRRSSIGNVQLRISNRGEDGDRKRLSEAWSTFWGELFKGTVSIYVMAGAQVSGLADAAKFFEGKLRRDPSVTDQEITLDVEDIGAQLLRLELPLKLASDFVLVNEEGYKLAIVANDRTIQPPVGQAISSLSLFRTSSGSDPYVLEDWLIPGPKIGGPRSFPIVDHKINHDGDILIREKSSGLWMILDKTAMGAGFSEATNDGVERTRVELPPASSGIYGWLIVPPRGLDETDFPGASNRSTFNPGKNNVRDPEHIYDRRRDTNATLYCGNGSKGQLCLAFDNVGVTPGTTIDNSKSYLLFSASELATLVYTDTNSSGTFATNVVVESPSLTGGNYVMDVDDPLYPFFNGNLVPWTMESAVFSTVGLLFGDHQLHVRITVQMSDNPDNFPALSINQVQFRIYVNIPRAGLVNAIDDQIFVSVNDQLIGSEIATRSGLSASADNRSAAYLMERILRQTLGLSASQIDGASFDAAHNSDLEIQIKITQDDPVTVDQFIQELGENSNVGIFFNVAGQVRAVDFFVEPSDVTVNGTIDLEDLAAAPLWERTEIDKVVTRLDFNYDYWPGRGEYVGRAITDSTGTQADYGVREVEGSYRFFRRSASSGDKIDYFLVGHNGALVNRPHDVLTFSTKGIRRIEFEIGDWISLNDNVAALVPAQDGAAWSSVKWLLIGKSITERGIEYVGFRLYDVDPF